MSAMLDISDGIVETAVFGKQVEYFLNSQIGQYLLNHARQQSGEASDKLKRVSPWRRRRIQELQNTIACWEAFENLLVGAVQDGEQATRLLEES